jgi:type I restriction enzyme M protein
MLKSTFGKLPTSCFANSKLKSLEYSVPGLGLIFLRYADQKFTQAEQELAASQKSSRGLTDEQIEFLANIVRLYRGKALEATNGSTLMLNRKFPQGAYQDVPGLCRVATLDEIEAQGWSLNFGRYVGVAERAVEDFVFAERLEELNEELEVLKVEARELEERIAENVMLLLEGTA